jgi:tetratricopeptide (TPR) repeat protein
LDHGEPTHSLLIFDTTMRVPLVVRGPGVPAGLRLDRLTSGVDLMPSILELVGLPIPAEVQGESFVPALRGKDPDEEDRAIYLESFVGALQCNWGPLRALRTKGEKLIHGPAPALYAVSDDPAEIYNLAGREPERLERMESELQRRIANWSVAEAAEAIAAPDEEVLRKLAALGYISGGGGARRVTDSLSDAKGKTDPYEHRSLFDQISVAREDLRIGRLQEGIQGLLRVLHGDPGNPAALTTLGKAYFLELGRMDLARDHLEQSLASDPYQEEAHTYLAKILRAQGDLEGARRHAEAILAFQPLAVTAFYELAAICEALLYNVGIWLWARGNVDEARVSLERAVKGAPSHLDALYALGRMLYEQNDAAGAREYLQKALALGPAGNLRREIEERLRNIDAFLARQDGGTGS